jgi:PPM family protein phosphatase
LQVQFAGRSERGPRSLNQDSFFCDSTIGLFLVADGMGGHNAGEVASKLAVETVVQFVNETSSTRNLTWPFSFDPKLSIAANRLSVAMRLANQRVYEAGHSHIELAGMGTTLVAALIDAERLVIGHVGDSRAYRFHGGHLDQMTRDHTWVAAMLAAEPTARTEDHPMRHVLTNGIGMREDVTPVLSEHPIMKGDSWVLCSDGVHGYIEEHVLSEVLGLESPDAAAADAVRAALEAGGTDNATAVVMRFV